MKTLRLSNAGRTRLDQRFRSMEPLAAYAPPVHGWLKAIREALGMSMAQLAKRAGVSQPSIAAMEQSEAAGTIRIETLRRIAQVLDCQLVYALVPNQPLEQTVRKRAALLARRRLDPIEHSMALEDQKVTRTNEALIDEIVRETNPRRLWDDA